MRGFGLVEVMVVIAIVGVLSGVAIPAMSGIFSRAESASALRNAQNIVSYFNAARAAGNKTSFDDIPTAVAAITSSSGVTGEGKFASVIFTCRLSGAESAEATAYIDSMGSGSLFTLAMKAETP